MTHKNIAFIGAGDLGTAIIGGLIDSGYSPQHIWATRRSPEPLEQLHQQFGIHVSHDNSIAAKNADVIVLCVAPKDIETVCAELKTLLDETPALIVSVAARVRTQHIADWLNTNTPIVRAMPNTPVMIGAGATGLFANAQVSDEEKNTAESIFRSVGVAHWLNDEDHIDVVTALSGGGPAYVFMWMNAMQNAALALGLPEDAAKLLTLQTVQGASRMAMESSLDLATLQQAVTTPNGTTEQAIRVFEQSKLGDICKAALQAAFDRAHA